MERSDELCRYIDFARIRGLLAARRADDHNSGWEQETHRAMQAFTLARYLDRMWRRNTYGLGRSQVTRAGRPWC